MIISFVSGYLTYFVLVLLQIPIVHYIKQQQQQQYHQSLHSFISNLLHLLAFLSIIQIWRGLWIVCELYLNIPEHHDITLWLCYSVSFIVLTCGLAACSLNGPGGSKDTYVEQEPILIYKFDYLSTLLKVNLKCLNIYLNNM